MIGSLMPKEESEGIGKFNGGGCEVIGGGGKFVGGNGGAP